MTMQCSHCRSETAAVSVDAGAGNDLPLFVIGDAPAPASGHVIQVVRQSFRGQLCLNCGLLVAQTTLSRSEIAAYKDQLARMSGPPGGGSFISPRSPTWVKRGPSPGLQERKDGGSADREPSGS